MQKSATAALVAAFVACWLLAPAVGQEAPSTPAKEEPPASGPGAKPDGQEAAPAEPPKPGEEPKAPEPATPPEEAKPGEEAKPAGEPKKEETPAEGGKEEEKEAPEFFSDPWGWGVWQIEKTFADWKKSRTLTLDEEIETGMRRPQKIRDATQSVYVIKSEEINERGAHYLDESLATAPGLEVWNLGWWASPSHLSLHGLYERHALVVVDGRPINSLWDGACDTSWIPLVAARRIEVVKGPSSHSWGSGAMGGVVQVLTRDPTEDLTGSGGGVYLNWDSFEVRGWNSWKEGPFGYFVGGSVRRTQGFRPNSELLSDDSFVKVVYDLEPERFTVKASLWMHRDDHGVPGSDPPPGLANPWGSEEVTSLYDNERKRMLSATLAAEYVSDPKTVLSAILYSDYRWVRVYTRGPGQAYAGLSNYYAYHANPSVGATLRADLKDRIPGHRVAIGVDLRDSSYQFQAYEEQVTAVFDPDAPRSRTQDWRRADGIVALWANDTWEVAKWLTLEGAFRFDFHHRSWFHDSYHVGAVLKIDPHTVLRAAVSRGYRLPSIQELYFRQAGTYHPWTSMTYPRVRGNVDLTDEKILSAELGLAGDRAIKGVPLMDPLTAFGQGSVFYEFLSDQIDTIPPFGVNQAENLHRKVVWGVDLFLQAHPSKFFCLNFNYAWYWAYGYHYEATSVGPPITYELKWRRSDAIPHSTWRFEGIFNTGLGLKIIYFAMYAGARVYWWENIGATTINWERNSVDQTFRHGIYGTFNFFGLFTVFAGYEAYPQQSSPQAAVDPYPSGMGEEYTYPVPQDGFNVGIQAGGKF
jgi:outer membrane receptor protein involved in Fe transport